MNKKIIIAGGGPAGLTAAYELSKGQDADIAVFEKDIQVGGISKTVNYKGNRIDIGGHRFFSKSDTVMQWWDGILPTEGDKIKADDTDKVMLVRSRKSRILWMRKLFDYPLKLTADTILKLGLWRTFLIGMSYLKAAAFPIKPEKNLEQFFINRFGKRLYLQFFKDYTEKVWGVSCSEISSAWGAQRIKGISITKAIAHAAKSAFAKKDKSDIAQKNVETSLIENFFYPKLGPGLLWETVAEKSQERGVKVALKTNVEVIVCRDGKVVEVRVKGENGESQTLPCDSFVSTMPIRELIEKIEGVEIPSAVKEVAAGLMYRDFITVGLLCDTIKLKDKSGIIVKDNWIYIQESDVKVGRLQIFNNWSPYMVADKSKAWIGLEYFCQEGDELWSMADDKYIELAKQEMASCGVIDQKAVNDAVVIRIQKAYPAYFGSYGKFDEIRKFLDSIENLFCIGRNGQHRYNNMDHSMLSAMEAVKCIQNNSSDKSAIWAVNTEEDYHEKK